MRLSVQLRPRQRTELSCISTVKKWSVARPRGLSVNIAYNLVVACYGENKLHE